ncbi:MAG: hypothetical protein ABTQ30_15100 [Rhizobiaceae bacterium]
MIPPKQFLEHVIRPVLSALAVAEPRLHTPAAEQLLLGTAVKESGLEALRQKGRGPALSMFQIEPPTFHWLWRDVVLARYPRVGLALGRFLFNGFSPIEQLAGNQHFACGIARIRYWVVTEPLPAAGDVAGMARYWGAHYQTDSVPAQMREFQRLYETFCEECFQ